MHKQKLLASPQMDAILMWQRRPILQPTGPTNGWPTQPRRKSLSNREKQKCWLEVGPKLTYIGRAMDTENKRWYAKIQICPNSSYKQQTLRQMKLNYPPGWIPLHSLKRLTAVTCIVKQR